MEAQATFLEVLQQALEGQQFQKLTLSKPRSRQAEWTNVYARPVLLKEVYHLSCTLRFKTRDETKNFQPDAALKQVENWLTEHFRQADLFTTEEHLSLAINKKGKGRLLRKRAATQVNTPLAHDQQKQRPLSERPRPYLTALGIAGADGQILKQGRRKFRQINKYIELIGHLLASQPLPEGAHIVDMGSGKGYLTFALYDYLVNEKKVPVKVTGVELRPGLVEKCNAIAQDNEFEGLRFVAGDIYNYQPAEGIDMLIALHACDTATDDAIAKGVFAEAACIVVAPCCHKQVRKAMEPGADLKPMLQHGILLERQAEMLTDSIRSLLLEREGYQTKVFEFIGTEHTPKNVMITAVKAKARANAQQEIDQLKQLFGVSRHHLEDLLET
ncbi:MAG: SAM-dependent methyltransferase [Bacteroidota bacterium]